MLDWAPRNPNLITFRTPLIQMPRPVNADDIRRAFVANALSIGDASTFGSDIPYAGIGLEAGNPATRQAFEKLLGPGRWALDIPFRQWVENGRTKTEGISTCAMVALGLLRRMQVDCEDILDGYMDDIGTGLHVAIKYAKSVGAWQTPILGLRPQPGVILQVVKPMHVLTVIGWDGDYLISADGGQTGRRGLQACSIRRRLWEDKLTHVTFGGRRVDGWILTDLLGFVDTPVETPTFVTLPQGWEKLAA